MFAGTAPVLFALDWGTSSLRAYALAASGQVLASRRSAHGIMNLPELDGEAVGSVARFERALQMMCGDWLQVQPQLPLIACGMVGSRQGWAEAAYQPVPSAPADWAQALTVVPRAQGAALHIVPGLIQQGTLPNVMRGEETQIAGVLQHLDEAGLPASRRLIGLPGTHSKWAWVEAGRVVRFETFMTGEVYALLCQHSILGRSMDTSAESDEAAFMRGLRVARSSEGALGPLSNIFSSRTLGLTGDLPAQAQADYLSGLLIGHELHALMPALGDGDVALVLCGEPGLCRRYAAACTLYGLHATVVGTEVTASGLWRMACAAGLI